MAASGKQIAQAKWKQRNLTGAIVVDQGGNIMDIVAMIKSAIYFKGNINRIF